MGFKLFVACAFFMAGLGFPSVNGVHAAEKRVVQKGKTRTSAAKPAKASTAKKRNLAHATRNDSGAVGKAVSPGVLAVQSGSALVVEQTGGDALYQKNAGQIVPIASITKLMTAMVVLDGSPALQAAITITDDDVDYLRGSRSRLHVGSVLSRESALLLALMSSENRAANALARHYPGGMPAFVSAMNIKAQALGMRDTRFEDPTGLTSNNVSTANDLAKMVVAAHKYPLIREFSTTAEATVAIGGREMAYRNTNPLVRSASWDVGLSKTGYINEAGKCLVMQARVADKPVVIVLLDSVGKLTRVGDANRIKRWMESTHASSKSAVHAAVAGAPTDRAPG
ncbi:MAG: D-alanyl-D-alanine endopeptidase [Propionivibrio sp.]